MIQNISTAIFLFVLTVVVNDSQLYKSILENANYQNITVLKSNKQEGVTTMETVEASSLTLSHEELTIKAGREYQLKLTVLPQNATYKVATWKSTDESIVTVNKKGLIRGKKAGTAKIIARAKASSGKKVVCTVTVKKSDKYTYMSGYTSESVPIDIYEKMLGKSYPKNCKVKISDLRYLRIQYYNFNGETKLGEMVVNKSIAIKTLKVFQTLYENKYPIEKMKLIDHYDADDTKSMEANNTSGFNYRKVDGSSNLSKHAYGLAIDINPKYNPYVKIKNGKQVVLPANNEKYANRNLNFKSKIDRNSICYKAFVEAGFRWGGNWKTIKDYQHFYW